MATTKVTHQFSYLFFEFLNGLGLRGQLCLSSLGLSPDVAGHAILGIQRAHWHGMMRIVSYIKCDLNGDMRNLGLRWTRRVIANSNRVAFAGWPFPMDGEG